MEGRGVLVHIGYEPVHVHYLERPFIAAFPNVQLVSDEGAVFRLNSALLASSSPKLKSLLSDADSSEPFTTIHTEIGKKHLSIFCQFITTGTLPMAGDGGLDNPSGAPLSPDTVESFRHLGVNLRELRLTPTLSPVNVKVEFNPDEKSGVPDGIFEMVMRNGHKPTTHEDLFDDVFSDQPDGWGGDDVGFGGETKERDERGMPTLYKDLFHFPSVGERDLSLTYQCPLCIRGFSQEYQYRQHLYRHEARGPQEAWACDICDGASRFPTVKQLLNHKRKSHKDMCSVQLKVLDYALRMIPDSQSSSGGHPSVGTGKPRFKPLLPPKHEDWEESALDDSYSMLEDVDVVLSEKVAKKKKAGSGVGRKRPKIEPESDSGDEYGSPSKRKKEKRIRVRAQAGELKCDRCEFSSNKEVAYKNHMLRHEAEDLQKEPVSFFCKICNTTFNKGRELRTHMESTHPGEVYIFCTKCSKEFDSQEQLSAHMKVHQMHHESAFRITVTDELEGTYDAWFCKECKDSGVHTQFRTREEWNSHRKEEHLAKKDKNQMEWECGDCEEKFYSKGANELVDHRIAKHPAGGLVCQYCGKDFTKLKKHGPEDRSRINLIQHMRKHKYGTWGTENIDKRCICCGEHFTQQMKFSYHMKKYNPKYHNNRCPICEGVTFDSYEEHKHHNDTFHNGLFVFRCNDCPEYFETREQCDAHKAALHPSEKVVCPVCAKSISKSNMALHQKTYHGNKVHQCDQCDKSFSHITAFNHHYRSHLKIPCVQCGMMVSERQMDRHIKSAHTRSEDKPFQCTRCNPPKGFLEKTHLEEHMNIHNGLKPFRCELGCPDVAYANRGNLAAHVRSVHKGIKRNYSRRNR